MNFKSEFDYYTLNIGEFMLRNYYFLERLRSVGDINIYFADRPFPYQMVRDAAYHWARRRKFEIETLWKPEKHELWIARVDPTFHLLKSTAKSNNKQLRRDRLKLFDEELKKYQPLTHSRRKGAKNVSH